MSTYSTITHPWLLDSTIAADRVQMGFDAPWTSDTLCLLEKEFLQIILDLRMAHPKLHEVALG